MRFVQHHTNNAVLGAPPGVSSDNCRALPITRVQYQDGTPAVQSFWQPSAAERAAIVAGAPILLQVWGVTHAPLYVGVDGVEEAAS
jgi:hypothetical protein